MAIGPSSWRWVDPCCEGNDSLAFGRKGHKTCVATSHWTMDFPRLRPGHNLNDRSIRSPGFASECRDSRRLLVCDCRGGGVLHLHNETRSAASVTTGALRSTTTRLNARCAQRLLEEKIISLPAPTAAV